MAEKDDISSVNATKIEITREAFKDFVKESNSRNRDIRDYLRAIDTRLTKLESRMNSQKVIAILIAILTLFFGIDKLINHL